MARYITFRVMATIPLLFAIAVLTFLISVGMETRGSVAVQICGEGATPECIAEVESKLGLNDPLPTRFASWLGGVVQGDLGSSLANSETEVTTLIGERIWPTISIVALSMAIGVSLGMMMGIASAIRPGGALDQGISVTAGMVIAMPGFIIGMLLSWWLAVKWGWFDPTGYVTLGDSFTGWLKSITLPAVALALPTIAIVQRQLRSSMANALQSRYVLAARARGVGLPTLIARHALPNAMIPTVTVIGFRAAAAIGLTVAVELVFGIRGMGEMLITSIVQRDVTVLQGGMLVVGLAVAVVNIIVDISYGFLNPKVRLGS